MEVLTVTQLITVDAIVNDYYNGSSTGNGSSAITNKNSLSHIMHSTLTAESLVEENKVSPKKRSYMKKVSRVERRKKKEALQRFVKKKFPAKRRFRGYMPSSSSKKAKSGEMVKDGSIRTNHEMIFESYLKLLGMPYHINHIFCFNCSNFYNYGDQISIPKKCQVCRMFFHPTYADRMRENQNEFSMRISSMSRPDFILDFNSDEDRNIYRKLCFGHNLEKIKEKQEEYMSRVSIIRIDGSIHQKQTQMIKDYHQYNNYIERGVKVFIVQNDEIDELVAKDAGKSMLELVHMIGRATVDTNIYGKYQNSAEFRSRVRKPF